MFCAQYSAKLSFYPTHLIDKVYVPSFDIFSGVLSGDFVLDLQASEESELPVLSDIGSLGADKATADTVNPSANSQIPTSSITAPVTETASVMASLRMVCLK